MSLETIDIHIKDLGTIITGGTPPTKKRDYYGNLVPLIKPTDMVLGQRYIGDTEESLSEMGVDKFKKKLVPKNTPCVVTIGTIGKSCLTKELSLVNQAVNCVVVDESRFDYMYVYYLMQATIHKVKAMDSGTASGRENVSKSVFESIDVRVVKLKEEQKKIGQVLSSYDTLVENNNRRIVILEDMAQSLYREWFVKFRFPGHENCKFKDSSLGKIPEGWEELTIGDVAKVKGGKRLPKGKKVLDDETSYPYLRVKDFGENGIDRANIKFIDEESHLATQRYIITTKDVYVSIAGTIGRVGIIPFILNNAHLTENAAKITGITQPFLQHYIHRYLHSGTGRKLLISRASGSSQPKLALYKIAELSLLLPTEEILKEFNEYQESMTASIHLLENKNENLIKQRDMLLPKLISGKIDLNESD